MGYLSLSFVGLIAVLLILYYSIPKKWNMRGLVLLIGSIVFYCCSSLNLTYLVFTLLSTFLCALILPRLKRKKLLFILCIFANIAAWYVAKVLPWTIQVFKLFGINLPFGDRYVIAALGISYFTLQAIGYLADVYKGKIQPEKNPFKYLLFVTYFPAIVQGPISRYDELMPQLLNKKSFSFDVMRKGLIMILFGLVKKLVIADRVGIFVNTCFDNYIGLNGAILFIAALGYSIQLYMDFSGCVDICRGVSSLFNVELINNFNRPYLATSIKDFWGRWHISLSRWLKDYVYIPLGGNRNGTFRKYINLMITFLVSGLWHGAGLPFFFWGALHAFYQIIGQCTINVREKAKRLLGIKKHSASERIYQTLITFSLVTIAWVFFRSDSFRQGAEYIYRILVYSDIRSLLDGSIYNLGVSRNYFALLIIHVCLLFTAELCTKNQDQIINGIVRQHLIIRWVIYLVLAFDVILFGIYGAGYNLSGFMYGGF